MSENQKEWRRLARRVVQTVNAGWWVERFNPLLVLFSIAAGITILTLRNQRFDATTTQYLYAIAACIGVLGIAAWLWARARFIRLRDGYVRIEKEMRLHNALSTALEGVGAWPDPPAAGRGTTGFAWRWSRVVGPVMFAATVIASAILIPVTPLSAVDDEKPNEPLAWEEMESWLEKLEDEKAVEKTDLEQVKDQIEQLRDQAEEDWFSHSSMEATDTLKQQLRKSIRELGADSGAAQRSLGALEKFASQLSQSAREQLMSEYNEGLKGMQSGKLNPNAALMNALKEIDLNNLSQMSPAQMQQLMDQLQQTQGACKECLGGMEMPQGWQNDSDMWSENQLGAPNQRFPDGGKIQRGPGEAPISLANNPSDLGTLNPEGVLLKDYSRATFGDTLAVGEGEHNVDKTKTSPQSAGAVESQGEGGERIWRESLLPEEREVLKRYFK